MSNLEIENNTNKENEEYKEVSLFTNPISTLSTLLVILYEQFKRFGKFLISNKILLFLGVLYLGLNFVNGPHKEVK